MTALGAASGVTVAREHPVRGRYLTVGNPINQLMLKFFWS